METYWVNYIEGYLGEKGKHAVKKTHTSDDNKAQTLIDRDVSGKTYLLKVLCDMYHYNYFYLFHSYMLY